MTDSPDISTERKIDKISQEFNSVEKQFDLEKMIKTHKGRSDILKKEGIRGLSKCEDFIDDCLSMNSDEPQKYIKRDSQYDNLCSIINNIIEDRCILVDFGSGPYLNLFAQLIDYDVADYNRIHYFALEEYSIFSNIPEKFDINIKHYENKSKKFDNVLFRDYKRLEDYIKNNINELADIIIVKNVTHEVQIHQLPIFLEKIISLTKENGRILFYDLSDIAEPYNYPWDIQMYEENLGL